MCICIYSWYSHKKETKYDLVGALATQRFIQLLKTNFSLTVKRSLWKSSDTERQHWGKKCVYVSLSHHVLFFLTEWESPWPLPVNDVGWSWVFPHCGCRGNSESHEVEPWHSWMWSQPESGNLHSLSLSLSQPPARHNVNKLAEKTKLTGSARVCRIHTLECQHKYTSQLRCFPPHLQKRVQEWTRTDKWYPEIMGWRRRGLKTEMNPPCCNRESTGDEGWLAVVAQSSQKIRCGNSHAEIFPLYVVLLMFCPVSSSVAPDSVTSPTVHYNILWLYHCDCHTPLDPLLRQSLL